MNITPHPAALMLALSTLLLAAPASAQDHADMTHTTSHPLLQQPGQIHGMWVWLEKWIETDAEQDHLLDFAQQHGVNLLLIQIHREHPTATPVQLKYPDQLRRLLTRAAERGIRAEALDGAPAMAEPENLGHTIAILDAVIAFNKTLPENARFLGMHYDIEPYVLTRWADQAQRDRIMANLITFYEIAADRIRAKAPDMTLSTDIPFWYDELTAPDNHTFAVRDGVRKPLYQHLIDLTDYIGIMSYRQHATGPNSITHHVRSELEYAAAQGKRVCPAMETLQIPETPQISFYDLGADRFWQEKQAVFTELHDEPGFAGVLMHCYMSIRDLVEGTDFQHTLDHAPDHMKD